MFTRPSAAKISIVEPIDQNPQLQGALVSSTGAEVPRQLSLFALTS